MAVYYNENDRYAVQWLRNLIGAGHLPPGDVDDRDIREVQPDDLKGYHQHHFFAGIGGWALAVEYAGWEGPIWTGSCPCQPFSVAGRQAGTEDPRHLWPEFFRLIAACRPVAVVGEQVASAGAWLDLVAGDLEGKGYSFGAVVLGAHSVGAPHQRQRLWWCGVEHTGRTGHGAQPARHRVAPPSEPGGALADTPRLLEDGTTHVGASGARERLVTRSDGAGGAVALPVVMGRTPDRRTRGGRRTGTGAQLASLW